MGGITNPSGESYKLFNQPIFNPRGGTSFAAGNFGARFLIAPKDCVVSAVCGYVVTGNGTSLIRPALYSANADFGNLLGQGAQVTGITAGFHSLPLSSPVNFSKGDIFWAGWQILTTNLTMGTLASQLDGGFFAAVGALPASAPAGTYNSSVAMCFWAENS